MKDDELKEVLQLLHDAGMEAQLCDTPVVLSGDSVVCGIPREPGDFDISDYILLPKALVGMYPEIFIPADGDSMEDAGYEEGDQLRVRLGADACDGDNALVWVDGRCTVKTLFTDEEGVQWLVPRNEKYDAIPLDEDMDVRILGRVVAVEKTSNKASSRVLLKSIRRTKNKMRNAQKMSDEEVDERIVRIGEIVIHARQWYAVYRAMCDRDATSEGEYAAFCARVAGLLPQHKHLPEPKELSRMAVQSFARPVALWTESNAPVRGTRYRDYLHIAMTMADFLGEK